MTVMKTIHFNLMVLILPVFLLMGFNTVPGPDDTASQVAAALQAGNAADVAKKMIDRPAESTSMAVPRSGWRTISAIGTISKKAATAKSSGRNCPSRFWNHQASISGTAILRISLGWKGMPTLSQRLAPFLVTPKTATAISSVTPTR